MDKVTAMALDKGRKNNKLLIQPQYSPMPVGEQVAILYCGTHALMSEIAIDQVPEFQSEFLTRMRAAHRKDVLDPLSAGKIDETIIGIIENEASAVVKSILAQSHKA